MGRRKERRLAAMAAAGRRVKLDLFLDHPPGEASHNDGIGGENRDQQTVVPTSSSSGCDCSLLEKKENPLALLGQYSDDEEEDEEAADQPTSEAKESPGDASGQLTSQCADTAGDNGVPRTEPSASVSDQQAPQAGDIKDYTQGVTEENTTAPESTLQEESVKATESVPDSSGMQIIGDVGGNWKAVMHEQSNQCYYWNTVTGETSWDIPNGLASGVATASVPSDVGYSIEAQTHVLPHSTLEPYPSDMSVGNGTATYANFGMACSAQVTQDAYAYPAPVASHELIDIDPLYLAKYGDDLLQRLNLLERLCGSNEGLELIRREIRIRISDCNALSSYGSSLLPLWLHVEVHLKQLDSSISKLERSYHADAEPRNSKTEVAEHKAPDEADMTPSNGEALKSEVGAGITIDENVDIDKPASTSSAQNSQDRDLAAVPPKVESDNDEDMDVEMEVDEDNVEEQAHCSPVPKQEHPPSEQLNSSNLPSFEDPTPPPEDNSVPPPPLEEEWIPPPPPENEPAPPAPPEEPAASYVQMDTIPQPYIAQANVGYAISGMEYYGTVGTEGTNANYYMQVSEPHVIQAQQHSYYAPVSVSGTSVSVDGTSVAPESYYAYPSVTMASSTIAAEHSGYYASSISAISSSAADVKTCSASLVSANTDSDLKGLDKVISNDASIVPLTKAVVATSAAGTTSVLESSTKSSSSTTNQTKVIRSKKRAVGITSSLRSNKKVSSLVDKWKAAKEELREEEEDEPESALEALERKRQKEIEEWRKQQIASGEAQENANFVPVRGDWRDRVKRRRAEAKKESKDDIVAASLSSSEQHKGLPDLAELCKCLPTGWQAYLDESTKQVYYGNNLTSETSWERPTK